MNASWCHSELRRCKYFLLEISLSLIILHSFLGSSLSSLFCWFFSWISFLFPLPSVLDFLPENHACTFSYLLDISIWWYSVDSPNLACAPYQTCFLPPCHCFGSWHFCHIWSQVKVRDFTIIFNFFQFFFTIYMQLDTQSFWVYLWNTFWTFFFPLFCRVSLHVPLTLAKIPPGASLTLFPLIHFRHCYQSSYQHSWIILFSCLKLTAIPFVLFLRGM